MRKRTTQEFIERARNVHGDSYDYSLVNYAGGQYPVTIICPIHGTFNQTASSHLSNHGCPTCGGTKKYSNQRFIEQALQVHGEKYGYTDVDYKNAKTNVSIICPVHGEFLQTPSAHLIGHGCQKCGGSERLNEEEFLRRAIKIHGNKYDYSDLIYETSRAKVTIICPEHGSFQQRPYGHLAGKGCPECANENRSQSQSMGIREFVRIASEIHHKQYDYSLVEYKNWDTPVSIICSEHGIFRQRPGVHLRPAGCPSCGHTSSASKKYSDTQTFISKARTVHGNQFDYSKAEYHRAIEKIVITCPTHGDFKQTPNSHLNGSGCPDCGRASTTSSRMLNTAEYIDKAQVVHGDTYDYSFVKYTGATEKISIRCPEHGLFKQQANNHLTGNGCPECASSGIDVNAPGILYYLRVDTQYQTFWKIGITNRTVKDRFVGNMDAITIVASWKFKKLRGAMDREMEILKQFAQYRYRGPEKPLHRGGNSELFVCDVLELDDIHPEDHTV